VDLSDGLQGLPVRNSAARVRGGMVVAIIGFPGWRPGPGRRAEGVLVVLQESISIVPRGPGSKSRRSRHECFGTAQPGRRTPGTAPVSTSARSILLTAAGCHERNRRRFILVVNTYGGGGAGAVLHRVSACRAANQGAEELAGVPARFKKEEFLARRMVGAGRWRRKGNSSTDS